MKITSTAWRHGHRADTDIEPAWADEAVAECEAIWIAPDPASASGRTFRVIGYSTLARCVIVVILLPEDANWIGVNAWKANSSDQRCYSKEAS